MLKKITPKNYNIPFTELFSAAWSMWVYNAVVSTYCACPACTKALTLTSRSHFSFLCEVLPVHGTWAF